LKEKEKLKKNKKEFRKRKGNKVKEKGREIVVLQSSNSIDIRVQSDISLINVV
jgi:hypothetical protein